MFESYGTEEWAVFIGVVSILVGLGCATLRYAFKVERNTAATAASNDLILDSLNTHKAENDEDHKVIHGRIDAVGAKVDEHGEKIAEHSVHIDSLLNKGC